MSFIESNSSKIELIASISSSSISINKYNGDLIKLRNIPSARSVSLLNLLIKNYFYFIIYTHHYSFKFI